MKKKQTLLQLLKSLIWATNFGFTFGFGFGQLLQTFFCHMEINMPKWFKSDSL